jgi:hypothetical protein
MSKLEGSEDELALLKEIDKLRHLIRLQLNPDPEAHLDREIEKLIIKVPSLTHELKQDELKESLDELIVTSQNLLKTEWEKVKEESKRGDLKDNEHCLDPIFRRLNGWCLNKTRKWTKSA